MKKYTGRFSLNVRTVFKKKQDKIAKERRLYLIRIVNVFARVAGGPTQPQSQSVLGPLPDELGKPRANNELHGRWSQSG